MKTITTKNEQETLAFARHIAHELKGGEVLLLQGELGAGKTTFARGLARALGIKSRIKSPTFTLMHVHQTATRKHLTSHRKLQGAGGRKRSAICRLIHCDAYRINAQALKDIGLMDYLGRPDTIVVVEWGEKIKPLLRERRYTLIKFQHGKKENKRIITTLPH